MSIHRASGVANAGISMVYILTTQSTIYHVQSLQESELLKEKLAHLQVHILKNSSSYSIHYMKTTTSLTFENFCQIELASVEQDKAKLERDIQFKLSGAKVCEYSIWNIS